MAQSVPESEVLWCLASFVDCCFWVPLQGAGGSGSFSAKRSPLGGKGLVHSDSTVQMQFHMAERMEENPRIWQVRESKTYPVRFASASQQQACAGSQSADDVSRIAPRDAFPILSWADISSWEQLVPVFQFGCMPCHTCTL